MLGIWLSVAQVVISGYQPIAEQTWVQLNPEYYPLHRSPPAMFVAWRGNQFPLLELKQKKGRWQVLFPARLVPPFDLFEGEAQLSKAYLARLRRIDEAAYGLAPIAPVTSPHYGEQAVASLGVPFMAEFTPPAMPGQPRAASLGAEPQGVSLALNAAWRAPDTLLVHVAHGEVTPAVSASPSGETLTLSAPAVGNGKRVCHQVASGETLWRIAATLAQNGTVTGAAGDTYSYLLAIVDDNRPLMGNSIRVKAGDTLYCPAPQTLARFDALSAAERQQRFVRLEQGR
ncbi:hypothetical protein [Aeromonas sp. HMWF014]|uniref:hypothetical protein n=1 Tax=Aeromonas sp. HMWF014 TaxID=2056850 RepID=UPI000D394537|nr:hypothetical protein [Aeromonas sp. HMWF014]PTT45197.1 hypothetical protein DBR19_20950 [Aeromonas sp. HMWF014]